MSRPRTSSSRIIPWLLFGVVALIAYGSLYPFNFKPDAIKGGVLQALGELTWARAGRADRISNVLLYLPFGFCLFLWLNTRLRRVPAVALATLIGAAFSLCIEVAQVYVSIRVPSLTDLSLNTLGAALGAIGGIAWRIATLWMHLPHRVERPVRDTTAGLLLVLWLLWRFAPFVPHFDLVKLKSALRPLFDPELNLALTFAYLTSWLVVSQALGMLVSRARLLESLLVLMAIVLVGRLLVANQAFVPAELLSLVLLLPLLVLTDRLAPEPRKALLLLSLSIVFLGYRLAPFELAAAPGQFDFWPFLSSLDAGIIASVQAIDWPLLFGHAFLFGALLWAIKHCGASMNVAAAAMFGAVLLTEVLRLWITGQSGSITDPALAAAVATCFVYIDRRTPALSRATARFGRSP